MYKECADQRDTINTMRHEITSLIFKLDQCILEKRNRPKTRLQRKYYCCWHKFRLYYRQAMSGWADLLDPLNSIKEVFLIIITKPSTWWNEKFCFIVFYSLYISLCLCWQKTISRRSLIIYTLSFIVRIFTIIYAALQHHCDERCGPESWSSLLKSLLAENNGGASALIQSIKRKIQ